MLQKKKEIYYLTSKLINLNLFLLTGNVYFFNNFGKLFNLINIGEILKFFAARTTANEANFVQK